MSIVNQRSRNAKSIVRNAVVFYAGAVGLFAQTTPDTMPQRGLVPTGSYAISDLETINVVNGNVFYRIPLASLPSSPTTGFTGALSLVYNSQIYDLNLMPGLSSITHDTVMFQYLKNSDWGGWKYGYMYSLDLEERPISTCTTIDDPKVYKLRLISPDGSPHTLHLYPNTPNSSNHTYSDYNGSGYYEVSPTGNVLPACPGVQPLAGDLTYYTSDGTFIKVVIDHVAAGPPEMWTNHRWRIFFPDGRIAIGRGPQMLQIADSNGTNGMDVINVTDASQFTIRTLLSDAFARLITIQYNPNAATPSRTDTITQTGYPEGGTPRTLTWTVVWTTVSLSGSPLEYGCSDVGDVCPASSVGPAQSVVSSIGLPTPQDGSAQIYSFGYATNNIPGIPGWGWGELNDVTLPSGVAVQYRYHWDNLSRYSPSTENPVSEKVLLWADQGDTRSEKSQYVFNPTYSLITNPDGGIATNFFYDPQIMSSGKRGLVYKVIQPDGSTTERIWWQNRPLGSQASDPANPYVKYEFRSLATSTRNPDRFATKAFSYDKNGNQTQVVEYGSATQGLEYGWTPYGQLQHVLDPNSPPKVHHEDASSLWLSADIATAIPRVRATTNTYALFTSAAGDGTLGAADETNAYWNPGSPGVRNQVTQISTSGVGPQAITQFAYGDLYGHPNLIRESHWDSGTSTWLNTNYTYDPFGSRTIIQNPRGFSTTFTYDYSRGPCMTQKVIAGTRTFTYTCDSGNPNLQLIASETDVDHGITRTYDYDRFGRNTLVTETGGGLARKRRTAYYDGVRLVNVQSDLNSPDDRLLLQTTLYDQLGRVRRTSNPAGSSVETRHFTPQQGQPGNGYRYQLTSNPYLSLGDPTMGWTQTKVDPNGRVVEVQHYSGSALPDPWVQANPNTNNTGTARTSYSSYATTSTDEAGKEHVTYIDGLGRVSQVTETGIGSTTTYAYDALDDLIGVTQPGVSPAPSFPYSSLKRLISATTPESGATSYTYDPNGNLLTRTRGGIATSYSYGALDEITGKSYSGSNTPPSSYGYNRGWLTSSSSGSTMQQYTYDGLGRVATSTQTTDSQQYPLQYTYNLADGIRSMTLPSGRVVSTTYDGAGRPSMVQGTLAGTPTTYVTGASYAAHGALQQVNLWSGLVETRGYNARLQTTQIQLGTLLTLQYQYQNNGNVASQTIIRPVGSWTQTYVYDDGGVNGVNRLTSATETGSGSWSENYGYDQRGNRWVSSRSGSLPPMSQETANGQSWYLSNNRINNWGYDAVGNVTQVAGMQRSFEYDAENRQTKATINGQTSTYVYDADGRRVQKVTPVATTTYIYDAQGRLASERSIGTATESGTSYMTADHLGGTRLVTSSSGTVKKCYDYLPFGEEIPSGYAGRSGCYGGAVYPMNPPDIVSEKFTGAERDAETGLDYFGARYFSGAQGRFTSPDEPLFDQHPGDPQSWNLYSYVRNNPLKFTDPSGNDCIYKNTFDERAGTVVVETGSCSQKGGTYVAGTIGSITYDSNSNSLDYGYNAYKGGTASVGSTALSNPDTGMAALQRGTQLAGTVAEPLLEITLAFISGPGMSMLSAVPEVTIGGSVVLGKMGNLGQPRPGENQLDLPNQGSPKANWIQNSGKLRQAMAEGRPIRDASAEPMVNGQPGKNTGFLRAERNLLRDRGWAYRDGYWYPPKK